MAKRRAEPLARSQVLNLLNTHIHLVVQIYKYKKEHIKAFKSCRSKTDLILHVANDE